MTDLFTRVSEQAGRLPSEAVAIASSRGAWTLADLLTAATRLAEAIDRVAEPDEPVIALTQDIGGTAVLTLAADLASRQVVHAEPGLPLPPGGVQVTDDARAGDRELLRLGERLALSWARRPVEFAWTGVPERCQIFLTSGSTGRPNGVARPPAALLADAERVAARLGYAPGIGVVASAPAFHLYGHTYALLAPLISGATVYHCGRRSLPSQLASAARRERAQVLIAHPHQYQLLAGLDPGRAPDFGRLRVAVSAGAPLPAQTARAIISGSRFELYNCYGSSEAGAITLGPVTGSETDGDVGSPLPGVLASVSADGELLLRSDSLAAGHLASHGLVPLPLTDDGAYRTGDLAELDGGRIVLRGRIAAMINVAGQKVNPAVVASALAEHPAVHEVQVVAEPDPTRGQIPVARIVAGDQVTDAELLAWCRTRLAPFQLPRRFDFVTDLPRSATGKLITSPRGTKE